MSLVARSSVLAGGRSACPSIIAKPKGRSCWAYRKCDVRLARCCEMWRYLSLHGQGDLSGYLTCIWQLCVLESALTLTSAHQPSFSPRALFCVFVNLSEMRACFPAKEMHWCSGKDDTASWGAGVKLLCPRTTCTPTLGLCWRHCLLFAAFPRPLLLPGIGCSLYFPFYCLWLCCNGRCSIFVLHLMIFWRLLDIISHCIGGGLAEMMGDISCLSQRDGLCRACAFFSHSVMLCLGMCRGSSSMGRKRSPWSTIAFICGKKPRSRQNYWYSQAGQTTGLGVGGPWCLLVPLCSNKGANRFPLFIPSLYLVTVLPLVSVGKLQRRWCHLLCSCSG